LKSIFSEKGISLDRLKTFCLVAEKGSIVSAANGDPTQASQFSRQIGELGKVVGGPLFERKGKKLIITTLGRELLLSTKSYFQALEELRQRALNQETRIIIGAGEALLRWYLIPQIQRLRAHLPDVCLDLENRSTKDLAERLTSGAIDLAILREDSVPVGFGRKSCGELKYCLVIPRTLLPQKDAASLGNVDGLPMAAVQGDGLLNTAFLSLTRNRGIKPRIIITVSSLVLVKQMIQQTDVAGILPEIACKTFPEDRFVVLRDTSLDVLTRRLSVAFRDDTSGSSKILIAVAENISALFRESASGA
jgi:DNA-binding transcriptional LysR family regulator